MEALCQALLPALAPAPGDDAALFGLDAKAVGVATAMEELIAVLQPARRKHFRLILRAFDQPFFSLAVIGQARRFRRLSPADQERLLQRLATHRCALLRRAFQAVKRLASFLFYSATDQEGRNATWLPIRYTAAVDGPAGEARLRLKSIGQPTTLECDVCVVGSGAGGSVVAAELAAAGKRVIVLEAGDGLQAPDFDQRELAGMYRLYLDHGLTATRDLSITVLAGGALGGGTTVNWQTSLPTPAEIRDEWASVSGCRHFIEESFTRSLEAVMQRLHVSAAESTVNRNNAALRRGCEALGYRWRTIQRNAHGCDPGQCGSCTFGCRHGGKQSAAVTFLQDAQRQGETVIVPNCQAERVLLDRGRVTGVAAVATDVVAQGQHAVLVRAPAVVAAAGAIHSPALLLRSGLQLPALGRSLYLHPTCAVAGQYDDLIEPWHGPPQTILCDEFAALAGNYGFRLETAPAHPGMMAWAMPWFSARDHRRRMQQAAYSSVIIALVRDRNPGRVRLGRDGQPVLGYRAGSQEQDHLRQGMAAAARIHLAAGAREVRTLHAREHCLRRSAALSPAAIDDFCRRIAGSPVDRNWCMLFSAHQMGTCRMGRDRRTAVCDAGGQVFGVRGLFIGDASAFPASCGVNPMITIMGLAHHTAQGMKAL